MQRSVSDLTTKFTALFHADGQAALCEHYRFPLPVQAGNRLLLCHTHHDLTRVFTAYLDGASARGQTRPSAELAAMELPRRGRFRVWMDWCFRASDTQIPVRERTIYYCRLQDDQVQIEMIACTNTIPARAAKAVPRRKTA